MSTKALTLIGMNVFGGETSDILLGTYLNRGYCPEGINSVIAAPLAKRRVCS